MPDKLKRLLKSHEFVHRALVDHRRSLAPADVARLERERDALFLELVTFTSSDSRVTLAQVRFLLTSLAAIASNADQAELLRSACLEAVDRLVSRDKTGPALPQQKLVVSGTIEQYPPQPVRDLLDSMTDRVGIADRSYRYVFANRANAEFYGLAQSDMELLPIANVVSPTVFRLFTKPCLDLCFSGQPIARYLKFHSAHRPRQSSTRLDPIYDQYGTVRWVMATIRDLTAVPIPSELVTELHE